jgi:hypothetical protein
MIAVSLLEQTPENANASSRRNAARLGAGVVLLPVGVAFLAAAARQIS